MRLSTLCIIIVLCAVGLAGAVGCDSGPDSQTSSTGATQANPGKIMKNSKGLSIEQANIQERIKITTDPNTILWIHLLTSDGQIVSRMTVRGKVTSSGKRLQPKNATCRSGEYRSNLPKTMGGFYTEELIQPDGTYGTSDAYVFWFDPAGRYHQLATSTAGISYLLTNYPIQLNTGPDALTGMYVLDQAAKNWADNRSK